MTNTSISKRYAKALLNIGTEDGNLQLYGQELDIFSQLCLESPDFLHAVSNPIFDQETRKMVLRAVLDKLGLSIIANNFLQLLLEKRRIGYIQYITKYYHQLTDAISNVVRAHITSAVEMTTDARTRIISALELVTKKRVEVDVAIDPSLIGGVTAKVGDLIFDGSVRTQLATLKESLKMGEFA
ncbi:MAG: ATP synthase F1 subunit delta [Deltaproteobacteria bacterium]|nr:ATP synthase F1 subunit delta [Deltaproteobacteria bacterium]